MDRTFTVGLFAGFLSECIALLNWGFGWPVISRKLSSAMMAFCIVALLGTPPFHLFCTARSHG